MCVDSSTRWFWLYARLHNDINDNMTSLWLSCFYKNSGILRFEGVTGVPGINLQLASTCHYLCSNSCVGGVCIILRSKYSIPTYVRAVCVEHPRGKESLQVNQGPD